MRVLSLLVDFLKPTGQKTFFYTSSPIFLNMLKCLKISIIIVFVFIFASTVNGLNKNTSAYGCFLELLFMFSYNLLTVVFAFACAFIVNFIFYYFDTVIKSAENDDKAFEIIQRIVRMAILSFEVMSVCKAKTKCTIFDEYNMGCTSGDSGCEEFFTEVESKRYDDDGEDMTCRIREFCFDKKSLISEEVEKCRDDVKYFNSDIYKALDRFFMINIKNAYANRCMPPTEMYFFCDMQDMLFSIIYRYNADKFFIQKVQEYISKNKQMYIKHINRMPDFSLGRQFCVSVTTEDIFSYFEPILKYSAKFNKESLSWRWRNIYN